MTKFSDDTIIGKVRNNEKLFVSHSKLDTDRMDCRKSLEKERICPKSVRK